MDELIKNIDEIASDLGFLAGIYKGVIRAEQIVLLGPQDLFLDDDELKIKITMKKMGYD